MKDLKNDSFKKYRQSDKGKEAQKRYYIKHREEIREKSRQYYQNHKEIIKKRSLDRYYNSLKNSLDVS